MSTNVPKAASGEFSLLYFASASTFTGKMSERLPAPLPLSQLFSTLEKRYSGIRSKVLESCMVTINLTYVDVPEENNECGVGEMVMIKEGDEVAIIPPVSSG